MLEGGVIFITVGNLHQFILDAISLAFLLLFACYTQYTLPLSPPLIWIDLLISLSDLCKVRPFRVTYTTERTKTKAHMLILHSVLHYPCHSHLRLLLQRTLIPTEPLDA